MSKRLTSLKDASNDVLDCRDLGHAWKHIHDEVTAGHKNNVISYVRIQQCLRCESTRRQTIDVSTMTIVKTQMYYVDNYLMVKGVRVNRVGVRFEHFDRAMAKRSEMT